MNRFPRRMAVGTLKALLAGAIWTQAVFLAGGADITDGASAILKLQVEPGSTTNTKTVTLSLGQSLTQVLEALHPAPLAADDDPWVAAPTAGGGHTVLFFASESGASPAPRQGVLSAAISYPTHEITSGVFILPEAVRGSAAGDFVMVDTADGRTTGIAVAALGMTPQDSKRLFTPAVDLASEERYAVYAAPDGSRTLLVFSPETAESHATAPSPLRLTDVVALPAGAPEAAWLLPRSRRGQPVPAPWTKVLNARTQKQ